MVLRPPKEARLFHEGQHAISKKRAMFSAAKLSKIFHFYKKQDTAGQVGDENSLIIKIKQKSKPQIGSSFDAVDLTALQKEPVKFISFDPFKDVEKKVYRKMPRRVWALTLSALLLMVGLHVAESYNQDHLLIGTKVGGQDLSFMTADKALNKLRMNIEKFSVTIKTPDASISPTANDLGIRFDAAKTVDELFARQRNATAVSHLFFWQNRNYNFGVEIDEQHLQEYFSQYKQYVGEPPRDASVVINKGTVEIVPEHASQVTGFDNPVASVLNAAHALRAVSIEQSLFTESPAITKAQLDPLKPEIQALLKVPLTFAFDKYSFSPSIEQKASWLVFKADKGVQIDMDQRLIVSYLDAVAKQHIKTVRPTVTSTLNGVVKELNAGISGFDIGDKNQVATNIIASLKAGSDFHLDLPIESTASPTISVGDADKWLDVNLSTRQVSAYSFQDKIKTFPFTAGIVSFPTLEGTFKVYAKSKKQDRYGSLVPNGFQPNVEYVTYFYRDFAIEAAPWQPNAVFGKTDATLGNVDLMSSDASWIYNWAPVGTTVVVHE